MDKLHNAQQQEEQLKQTFIDKKRQAINLEALQQQLKEIQLSFGALLKQLPTNQTWMPADRNQPGRHWPWPAV
jgi:type IV pilus assembly protein PilO